MRKIPIKDIPMLLELRYNHGLSCQDLAEKYDCTREGMSRALSVYLMEMIPASVRKGRKDPVQLAKVLLGNRTYLEALAALHAARTDRDRQIFSRQLIELGRPLYG